jgi:hypothetical protein
MAEVDTAAAGGDWTKSDRLSFTSAWNRANVLNLMRGASGASEYKTITQRTAFYNWFDQIREMQGHEIMWPAAAWIVAMQMSNMDSGTQRFLMTAAQTTNDIWPLLPIAPVLAFVHGSGVSKTVDTMNRFANEGNTAIFDDVFPKLAEIFKQGLKTQKVVGKAAQEWDAATLRNEQFKVVDPIYKKYTNSNPQLSAFLKGLASGNGVFAMGGIAIGNNLDFKGDILSPSDRYNHGLNVVTKFYSQFKESITSVRGRIQQSKPDPTAGGIIRAGS